ncbi:Uncharacterised protein [Mycobacteroides abscessus subsp. massiliense]|nr:Uncharacterised protein [Mycobacteroides abscessus subsp. massiliense]
MCHQLGVPWARQYGRQPFGNGLPLGSVLRVETHDLEVSRGQRRQGGIQVAQTGPGQGAWRRVDVGRAEPDLHAVDVGLVHGYRMHVHDAVARGREGRRDLTCAPAVGDRGLDERPVPVAAQHGLERRQVACLRSDGYDRGFVAQGL